MPFLRGRTHVESRFSRGLQIASLSRYFYRDPVLLLYDELKRNYPVLSTAYYFCYHKYEIRAFNVSASVQSLPQHSIINSKKVSLQTIPYKTIKFVNNHLDFLNLPYHEPNSSYNPYKGSDHC